MTQTRSPRKRYHLTLPDEPLPHLQTGAISQLALLVVIVNIAACLIAEHMSAVADTEQVAEAPYTRPAGPILAAPGAVAPDVPRAAVAIPGHGPTGARR